MVVLDGIVGTRKPNLPEIFGEVSRELVSPELGEVILCRRRGIGVLRKP